MADDASKNLALADRLILDRAPFDAVWGELRAKTLPRHIGNANPRLVPTKTRAYCVPARRGINILAGGHMSHIVTSASQWFSLASPSEAPTVDESNWFAEASKTMFRELGRSNFYTSIHEAFLDRVAEGTGCLFCDVDAGGNLAFKHIPNGTYALACDADGKIDTLVRSFRMTAHQAEQEYGRAALGEKIRKALDNAKTRFTTAFDFVQLVLPNGDARPGYYDLPPDKRPWLDIIICRDDKKEVRRSGFYEFPFLVTRYLPWGDAPYGLPPGWEVIDSINHYIDGRATLKKLGRVAVDPRLLLLAEQVGEVDLRAGGQTVISPDAASLGLPREWAKAGDYNIGLNLLDLDRQDIRDAYHVDMLQMFAGQDKQMTATEILAREREKILAFSPSYTLLVSDLTPFIRRIFAVLLRSGRIMPPTPDVMQSIMRATSYMGTPATELLPMRVQYNGPIATSIEALTMAGDMQAFDGILQYTQAIGTPEMLELVKLEELARTMWITRGADPKMLRSPKEMMELREQQRADAEAQQQLESNAAQSQVNLNNAKAVNAIKAIN